MLIFKQIKCCQVLYLLTQLLFFVYVCLNIGVYICVYLCVVVAVVFFLCSGLFDIFSVKPF